MPKAAAEMPQIESIQVDVKQPARDELHLQIEVSDGIILKAKLSGIGCSEMLQLIMKWRPLLTGKLTDIALPTGVDHASQMMRELLLKAQGKWKLPYDEDEVCHCRAVPTAKVEAAIISGCHTVDKIKRATSASTSCGTCRPDIEKILSYRLSKKA